MVKDGISSGFINADEWSCDVVRIPYNFHSHAQLMTFLHRALVSRVSSRPLPDMHFQSSPAPVCFPYTQRK
jgi:4-hydroxy-3-methylbut-2-en-1-yl diphosphate synthase IspG/GcpE